MRAWFTSSRRSASVLAGVVVAGINLWLALGARTHGFNLWSDLVTGLSSASLYTGTVAAGFAAFDADRWTKSMEYRVRFGTRTPALLRVIHASAVIAPIVAGYLVSLIVLEVYALASGTYGAPYGWWLVVFAAALIAAASFGYAIGVIGAGRWWVAPFAALAFYALFVALRVTPTSFGVKSLYPVLTVSDSVFVRHLPATMIAQTILFIGFAATVLLLAGGGWRKLAQTRLAAATVVAMVLVLAGIAGVVATNGQYTTGHNPRDFACSRGTITLCLNRGYKAATKPLQNVLGGFAERAAGTDLVPSRLEQNVEGIGDNPAAGARSVYVEQLGPDDMQFAVFRYVQKYGGSSRCGELGSESDLTEQYVDSWLSGYEAIAEGTPGFTGYQRLTKLPTADANAWFRANESAYDDCQLTLSDLP